jgi:hypothetical protein
MAIGRPRFVLVLTLLAGVLTACASDSKPAHGSSTPAQEAETGSEETGTAASEQARAPRTTPAKPPGSGDPPDDVDHPWMELYNPEIIPSFELTLDEAAKAILSNADEAAKKTWVHAQFTFGAIHFADVGVRVKGASTLRVLPEKASLKIKFNKWKKGQKLHGLEELTLNNMVSDRTFLAERLAYHVFRAADLPAPKANTARLAINGEDYGIFANIETPDEHFMARAFSGRAKSLYEVNFGGSWMPGDGYETGFEIDVPAPDAPAGTMPDVDALVDAVAAAKDESLLADLAPRLDTKQWLRHSAAEAVTGHADGHAYGLWSSHNYFMAGGVDGRFSLVPWSTDLALSDREGLVDASAPRPSIVLARCKASACWESYKTEVRSLLAVYESLDLVTLAKKWHDQIAPFVATDTKRVVTVEEHEGFVATLYQWLAARPGVVRSQLAL